MDILLDSQIRANAENTQRGIIKVGLTERQTDIHLDRQKKDMKPKGKTLLTAGPPGPACPLDPGAPISG